jgi:hypothetical protein
MAAELAAAAATFIAVELSWLFRFFCVSSDFILFKSAKLADMALGLDKLNRIKR